jgi:hypothetical protein
MSFNIQPLTRDSVKPGPKQLYDGPSPVEHAWMPEIEENYPSVGELIRKMALTIAGFGAAAFAVNLLLKSFGI